jgi:hypothetical protein
VVAFCFPLTIACSHASERAILDQFFAASRLRDKTALDRISTVIFEPRTEGTVSSFDITAVAPERRAPLHREAIARARDDDGADAAGTNDSERRVVERSVSDRENPVDLARQGGDLGSKEVTVSAPVRLPDGRTERRILIVTMQRAILQAEKPVTGRWIVSGVRIDDRGMGQRRSPESPTH